MLDDLIYLCFCSWISFEHSDTATILVNHSRPSHWFWNSRTFVYAWWFSCHWKGEALKSVLPFLQFAQKKKFLNNMSVRHQIVHEGHILENFYQNGQKIHWSKTLLIKVLGLKKLCFHSWLQNPFVLFSAGGKGFGNSKQWGICSLKLIDWQQPAFLRLGLVTQCMEEVLWHFGWKPWIVLV